MKIRLDKTHILCSDAYCFWITVDVEPKKSGAKAYEKVVSGYHPTAEAAMASYVTKAFRSSEAETVKALEADVQALIREVRAWKLKIR